MDSVMYMFNSVSVCHSVGCCISFFFMTFPIKYIINMASSYVHIYCMGFYGLFTKCTFFHSRSLKPPTCVPTTPVLSVGPFKPAWCFSQVWLVRLRRPSTNRSSTEIHECYMNNIYKACKQIFHAPHPRSVSLYWVCVLISVCHCQPSLMILYW